MLMSHDDACGCADLGAFSLTGGDDGDGVGDGDGDGVVVVAADFFGLACGHSRFLLSNRTTRTSSWRWRWDSSSLLGFLFHRFWFRLIEKICWINKKIKN